ncbi:MAG: serine/threonine protein kinase [Planctomycetes bacterium]|nr:serine/threonine protein kinase [Planctomycetota bacterium]
MTSRELASSRSPERGRAQEDGAPPDLTEDTRQLIGRIVNGKYQVLSILGEGGMGVVYKVRHLILQNKSTFALKILHPTLCAQPDFRARFLREVEIAMELTHENVVQIRDFGVTEQGLLFYTMDFFAGESLKAVIEREAPLSPERIVRIVAPVLAALGEAHKAGIVHRDLKPDNVLIERVDDRTDRVRILDFGIAKLLEGGSEDERPDLTQGGVIGTPRYMSPEQAGSCPIDGRSDLYSLGCMLFEMLTGRVPFSGKTARGLLMAHLTAPPPRLAEARPGLEVPEHLEGLVYRLLEKEREARPATAEAVLEILGGRPAAPAAPAQVPRRGRSRTALAAGAAVLAVLLGGAALTLLPTRPGATLGPGAPEHAPPRPSEKGPPSRGLRCGVCGAIYAQGEKLGDMCHGEPLLEAGE